MKKEKLSFVYRLVIILSLTVGLILNFANTTSIQLLISYYTMQSNMICLFGFIAFQIAEIKKSNYKKSDLYYALKGIVTIAIMVTFIVYICALLPNNMQMYTITTVGKNSKRIGNLLVHIISPLFSYLLYHT